MKPEIAPKPLPKVRRPNRYVSALMRSDAITADEAMRKLGMRIPLPPGEKRHTIGLQLRPKEIEWLGQRAKLRGVKRSELVREIVTDWLAKGGGDKAKA